MATFSTCLIGVPAVALATPETVGICRRKSAIEVLLGACRVAAPFVPGDLGTERTILVAIGLVVALLAALGF